MTRDLPPRIAAKIGPPAANGCRPWLAGVDAEGYGRVWHDGRQQYGHRVVYLLLVGAIPDGHDVHHVCGQRACVNPAHLVAVDRRGHNALHGHAAARAATATSAANQIARTHCKNGHPFDLLNTVWRPNGQRDCRACHRERQRQRRLALRHRPEATGRPGEGR
jgi:hypothetical protein